MSQRLAALTPNALAAMPHHIAGGDVDMPLQLREHPLGVWFELPSETTR